MTKTDEFLERTGPAYPRHAIKEAGAKKMPIPNKPKEDLSEFFSSSHDLYLTGGFVTHGGLKNGKSFFAATASSCWPDGLKMEEARSIESIGEDRWRKLKPVRLEDLIWLPYDLGALDGFPQFKIEVPSLDVRAIIKKFNAPLGVRKVNQTIQLWVEQNQKTKWVVEDTTSAKDRLLLEYFDSHPVMNRQGEEDKYAKYGSLKSAHIASHNALRNSGLTVHYLCHSKAAPEATTPHQKHVDQTMELPSANTEIEPEITGQSLKVYLGDASVIGVLVASELPGKPGKYKREFMPFGGKNFTGGNRLQSLLKTSMPPHMGEMIKMMRKAVE